MQAVASQLVTDELISDAAAMSAIALPPREKHVFAATVMLSQRKRRLSSRDTRARSTCPVTRPSHALPRPIPAPPRPSHAPPRPSHAPPIPARESPIWSADHEANWPRWVGAGWSWSELAGAGRSWPELAGAGWSWPELAGAGRSVGRPGAISGAEEACPNLGWRSPALSQVTLSFDTGAVGPKRCRRSDHLIHCALPG